MGGGGGGGGGGQRTRPQRMADWLCSCTVAVLLCELLWVLAWQSGGAVE